MSFGIAAIAAVNPMRLPEGREGPYTFRSAVEAAQLRRSARGAGRTVAPRVFQYEFQLATNPVLLDVRRPHEFAAGKIEGARLLDYYAADFKEKLAALPRNGIHFIYCRSGGRSGDVLKMMEQMGFAKIFNLAGGIEAWKSEGLPVVK